MHQNRFYFGRGSAPNHAQPAGRARRSPRPPSLTVGGVYKGPPDHLVGWGGLYPLSVPLPCQRIRRLDVRPVFKYTKLREN